MDPGWNNQHLEVLAIQSIGLGDTIGGAGVNIVLRGGQLNNEFKSQVQDTKLVQAKKQD